MKLLITGGTGFIGSALCSRLLADNHEVIILSRTPQRVKAPMQGISVLSQLKDGQVFDIVINLAGEPIANKRWSQSQQQEIINSRIAITQQLISYFKGLSTKPELFISGSAIGYYGIGQTDEPIDESSAPDNSFSSQLCQQWEAEARQAQQLGIRTCLLRTGIVLGHGGALAKMMPLFKLGLGGQIGQGKQWMPWVHLDDLVGIILYCITDTKVEGAINGTAPVPVTNQEFSRTLAAVLHRPCVVPLPAVVVKLLMGQMGEELLLAGKKILPQKIIAAGYQFKYNQLKQALLDIV